MPFEFTADPAWHRILLWPGLSAEAKLAWAYLWGLADLKPGTIRVRDADIGANQGSEEPKRAGPRLLKQLADRGLVVIVDRDGPECKSRMQDPAEVAQQPPDKGGGRPAA